MIWQDMSDNEKQEIYDKYKDIKKRIKSLNSIKANTEKKIKYTESQKQEYDNNIFTLQQEYDNIKISYKCDYCNKEIELPFNKIKDLLKGKTNPIFCNRRCSGIYYANKSHENKSEEEKQLIRDKISKSLKEYESTLNFNQKQNKYNRLNSFWDNLNSDERSIRNKNNAKTALNTMLKNNTFGQSKDESLIFTELKNMCDIKRQYYIKGYNFDFAINMNNQMTLIELNGCYWHNYRPFNNSINDIKEYNKMIIKGNQKLNIANKWRYMDVAKLNLCKENNYNYICLYFDNNQIKRDYEKVSKIILDNINKGIVIITKEMLSELIAAIG